MQVTETLSEGLKRGYTVVVPAADIETKRAARLANLGKTLKLPGFRPGKIPPMVVRQRYGTAVNAEVLEESVNEATQQVLTERGLRPALQPKIDVVSLDPSGGAGKDLEFKVELELLPEITLPDFGAIELTRMKVGDAPRRAVDKALADIAQRNRTLEAIPPEELGDRGAAKGEVLTVDYVGRIDGTEFPGGAGQGIEVEIGGDGFIPGFSEQLEGMRPGETPHDRGHLPRRVRRCRPGRQGGELRGHRACAEPRGGAGARRRAGEEAGIRRPGRDARDGHAAASRRNTTSSPGCG